MYPNYNSYVDNSRLNKFSTVSPKELRYPQKHLRRSEANARLVILYPYCIVLLFSHVNIHQEGLAPQNANGSWRVACGARFKIRFLKGNSKINTCVLLDDKTKTSAHHQN
jgi:hypothetical protein